MFLLKKLLLAATTLTLVGTASILPAQAITLDFRFTSPLPPRSLFNGNGGSLTIDDKITNLGVGNSGGFASTIYLANRLGSTTSGTVLVNRLYPGVWSFWGNNRVEFGLGGPGSPATTLYWRMELACSLNLKDCTETGGSFWAKIGISNVEPISYDGGITVKIVSPTVPPSPKVPEPSTTSVLLLLGGGWLLWRTLKLNTFKAEKELSN